MKKIIFIVTAALAVGMISCNSRENLPPVMPEDNVVTFEREFALPGMTRSGGETYTIIATFDAETENLIGYTISDSFYTTVNMTVEEVDTYLQEQMGALYSCLSDATINSSQTGMIQGAPGIPQTGLISEVKACLRDCKENSSRPFWCKTGCWVDFALNLLDILT